MNTKEQIKENIQKILSLTEGKARLLAATKTVSAEYINYAADCGVTLIGENRVNELLEKYDSIDRSRLEIHFIGALQTNKVKYIIDKVTMIHSVDRMELLREIEKQAAKHGIVMQVLVEVNIGSEPTKSGIRLEDVPEFCKEVQKFPHVLLRGLMAIPPKCDSEEKICVYFEKMRKIFVDISQQMLDNKHINVLSMGMSGDYASALKCGSNLIRVGSGIFGDRVYH